MMEYTIEQGKITAADGIPYLPRWFCDDLVAFEVDRQGISKVEYFNMSTRGSEKVFVDDMWGGLRFFIEQDGYHYGQRLKNCALMPYGFTGEWQFKNCVFRYTQRAVNNCIAVTLEPAAVPPAGLRLAAEFYDNWSLLIRKDGDNRYVNGTQRQWRAWTFDGTELKTSYREGAGETHIALRFDTGTEYIRREVGNPKNILLAPGTKCRLVIALDTSSAGASRRAADTLKQYDAYARAQDARYAKVQARMPVLESPYPALNQFFALAPLYHESCKVLSVPGGIRAKTEHYWIWGWDGMSSSFAYAYWGDAAFIGELLRFYMETADAEKGIGHFFARDLSHIETSMIPAQGFYISLLYQYWLNGGDIAPYYEFAKQVFHMILSTERGDTGLFEGYSLFPDFRNAVGETGQDLSTFNNSSVYCAVRAMETLARVMADDDTRGEAAAAAQRTRSHFSEILFDREKGYFAASADAVTLKKRDVYTSMAIKWDNLFCGELLAGKHASLLDFFSKNFVCEPGILPVPVWGKGYDVDANQQHCYWPSNSECYARLINFENRKDLIEQMIGWIVCWTERLMCPEGIDCYDNINIPKPDGWNAVNGTWQAYSMRAWYEAAIHSVVGVDFSEGGMHLYPYAGEEMTLKKLHYNQKTFDIYMRGSGAAVKEVVLNGERLGPVREIRMEQMQQHNVVEVFRGPAE